MFAYKEKLSLTITNIKDRYGRILPISIPLPLENENISLPKNISQLSIIEYHEGIEIYGHRAFNIYVGQTGIFRDLLNKEQKIKINPNFNKEIKSSKELIVYQQIDNVLDIFATVQGNDIVVENVEELNTIIKKISKEFSIIKKSASKIRKLGKRIKDNNGK